MTQAVIAVDFLYDFIDGSLACHHAAEAARNAASFIEGLQKHGDKVQVYFCCDCHPADHCSFKANGGIWPAHCVQGTHGADIHEALRPWQQEAFMFRKGCNPASEEYSGFEGHNDKGQTLGQALSAAGIKHVYVTGIATEFCVQETVKALLKAGFEVTVVTDALGYVNAEGHKEALHNMQQAGAQLV